MKKLLILSTLLLLITPFAEAKRARKKRLEEQPSISITQLDHLFKATLSNGMTVLVRPAHQIPKVAMQVWYNVGSKDEKSSERGIAHLIEHMIFKGTEELLSESDIGTLVNKLSGYCNATTNYDFTYYCFNVPTQYWKEILPVIADCMEHVRFDNDMLASELKAVIQELKLCHDNYTRDLLVELMSTIFHDHPYHYPIIGFKQDLWNADSELLRAFYKKHYCPNNATFVVVGDVDPDEVFAQAEEYFGHIPPNQDYEKEKFYHNRDLVTKTVTLYRDIKQPFAAVTWSMPGISVKPDCVATALKWIMGAGRDSRLYKKLVHELQLVSSVTVQCWSLFDHGMLLIIFYPKDVADIPKIEKIICDEFAAIAKDGVTVAECERALNKMRMDLYSTLENIEQQAFMIGINYLAIGDPEYMFTSLDITPEVLAQQIPAFVDEWLRSSLAHKGAVMPLVQEDQDLWNKVQADSDREDTAILACHQRETDVEPARYAETIEVCMPESFPFPKAQKAELDNGLKLLWHMNENTPQVTLILSLRVKDYYDAWDKQGLGNFVALLLKEGTKKHSATELNHLIESRGMALSVQPGSIEVTALKEDLPLALDIVYELLTEAVFESDALEKVRAQILVQIKEFWDKPDLFVWNLLWKAIYKDHPYAKDSLGTEEVVKHFTRDDVTDYYAKYMSPDGARLAVVGDIGEYDLQALVQKHLGAWQGPKVEQISFPPIPETESQIINYPINRDQVVLALATKSVGLLDPNYDAYLIYTQIFGGGTLGPRSSRLFELREESGLFYAIWGTLLANVPNSGQQPGMCLVRTMVSKDRLDEAAIAIKDIIAHAHETLTDDECEEAKRAIVNTAVDKFASNSSIANTFLFLDRYNLPERYFDDRAQQLEPVAVDRVKKAVAECMKPDSFVELRIGRVNEE